MGELPVDEGAIPAKGGVRGQTDDAAKGNANGDWLGEHQFLHE